MSARRLLALALALVVAGAVACAEPPPTPPPPPPPEPARVFDQGRAWRDLEALVGIGPRVRGTDGAARARAYLRGELEKAGIEVRETVIEVPPGLLGEGAGAKSAEAPADEGKAEAAPETVVHLVGVIPGERSHVVLLGAAYDTEPREDFEYVAANASGSGPAVVLELARAIAARPLPYTTWVAFLDGDLGGIDGERRPGSRLWARDLRDSGELGRIRLAVFFRQVADADLQIYRDIFSHRLSRKAFWRAAGGLGERESFPSEVPFAMPAGSHLSLVEVGMRRVVMISDMTYGGTEFPGAYAGSAEDTLEHCSPESLGVVGRVSLAALDDLSALLTKVDRLTPPDDEEAEPVPGEAETPGGSLVVEPPWSEQGGTPDVELDTPEPPGSEADE